MHNMYIYIFMQKYLGDEAGAGNEVYAAKDEVKMSVNNKLRVNSLFVAASMVNISRLGDFAGRKRGLARARDVREGNWVGPLDARGCEVGDGEGADGCVDFNAPGTGFDVGHLARPQR